MGVWGAACGAVEGGEGRKDITESYRGDQVQFIMKEPKPSCPHPLPQVMNNDRPPFSYLFIVFFLILLLHLFIYSFFITFFTKEEYQKELFYLAYLEGLQ